MVQWVKALLKIKNIKGVDIKKVIKMINVIKEENLGLETKNPDLQSQDTVQEENQDITEEDLGVDRKRENQIVKNHKPDPMKKEIQKI